MIVFGTLRAGEEAGGILYRGTLEECRSYTRTLNLAAYYDLNICEDNGVIAERIVTHN